MLKLDPPHLIPTWGSGLPLVHMELSRLLELTSEDIEAERFTVDVAIGK